MLSRSNFIRDNAYQLILCLDAFRVKNPEQASKECKSLYDVECRTYELISSILEATALSEKTEDQTVYYLASAVHGCFARFTLSFICDPKKMKDADRDTLSTTELLDLETFSYSQLLFEDLTKFVDELIRATNN